VQGSRIAGARNIFAIDPVELNTPFGRGLALGAAETTADGLATGEPVAADTPSLFLFGVQAFEREPPCLPFQTRFLNSLRAPLRGCFEQRQFAWEPGIARSKTQLENGTLTHRVQPIRFASPPDQLRRG